jgi:hypothetical protein
MCCRINTKGPLSRIIAGLYIFLATFLIGFFVVQIDTGRLFAYRTPEYDKPSTANVPPATSPEFDLGKFLMTKGCQNADGILIWRWHDVPSEETPPGTTIGITNNGSLPIHPGGVSVDWWARSAGPFEYSRIGAYPAKEDLVWRSSGHILEQIERVLEHSQTHSFMLAVIGDDKLLVTFSYQLGDDPAWRRANALIPRDSQFPVSCF